MIRQSTIRLYERLKRLITGTKRREPVLIKQAAYELKINHNTARTILFRGHPERRNIPRTRNAYLSVERGNEMKHGTNGNNHAA